ncbi:MAG: hypothetical protein GX220_09800 [Treponema sp.]|nr:hypothetical protein [Treponema sp.]
MKNIALAICLIVVSAGMFYSSLQSVSYYFKDKPEVEYLVLAIFLLFGSAGMFYLSLQVVRHYFINKPEKKANKKQRRKE